MIGGKTRSAWTSRRLYRQQCKVTGDPEIEPGVFHDAMRVGLQQPLATVTDSSGNAAKARQGREEEGTRLKFWNSKKANPLIAFARL